MEISNLDAIRLPPFWYTEHRENFRVLNVSQLAIDWEFIYEYVGIKREDLMLEVRSHYAIDSNGTPPKRIASQ